ncbi:MAG: zinc finger domain-containing protein, partial [Candidatus Bathycorpusculaceae bacterium]
ENEHRRYKGDLQLQTIIKVNLMSEKAALSLATCTSCSKPLQPGTEATKFLCPNCGEIQIRRCGKCRKFGRQYKCPKCGFIGP